MGVFLYLGIIALINNIVNPNCPVNNLLHKRGYEYNLEKLENFEHLMNCYNCRTTYINILHKRIDRHSRNIEDINNRIEKQRKNIDFLKKKNNISDIEKIDEDINYYNSYIFI